MPNQQEEVNRLRVIDSIQEPALGDEIPCFDHFRDIRIASKVIEHAKSHDTQTVRGCEIAIFLSNIIELTSITVQNLNIAGDVPFAIDFAELIEGLVCNICDIKLVVACLRQRSPGNL